MRENFETCGRLVREVADVEEVDGLCCEEDEFGFCAGELCARSIGIAPAGGRGAALGQQRQDFHRIAPGPVRETMLVREHHGGTQGRYVGQLHTHGVRIKSIPGDLARLEPLAAQVELRDIPGVMLNIQVPFQPAGGSGGGREWWSATGRWWALPACSPW